MAAAQALLAHRALGRMAVCDNANDFADAANDLLAATRGISASIATLARTGASDGSERRRAFTAWFAANVRDVVAHPIQTELHAKQTPPTVYVSRLARGSAHPPIREAMTLGNMQSFKPRPDDFYFEGLDKLPAIQLCSEYLDRVTNLLDQSKVAMARFGLE